MELKRGYKQTEVGMIPKDWDAKQIHDICKLINGRGFKPYEWQAVGLPIIRIQNLNGSEDFNYYSGQYNPKILVEHGQLLFAWSGSRGTSFGPHVWNGGRALLNYHTWKVEVNESKANPEFLLHALRQLTRYIEDRAHGASALVHTQKWEMEKFLIPIPQSIPEQRAIAEALGDVDMLLVGLDRLIDKKRNLKHAAMQRLLSGKTRLQNFHGEWESGMVKDYFDLVNSRNSELNDTVVTISAQSGFVLQEEFFNKRVASSTLSHYYLIKRNDFAYNRSYSNGYPYGAIKRLEKFEKGVVTTLYICFRLKADHKSDPRFFEHYFEAGLLNTGLSQVANEGGRAHGLLNITKADFFSRTVKVPTQPEQIAIAEALTDMDTELSALERRREKTRVLKQAMMQELLTGRTRLVSPITNVLSLPKVEGPAVAKSSAHNWQINEAVIIGVLAKRFGTEKFPLPRKRRVKLTYLLHRHAEGRAEGYLKKAAGPYNPATKYRGPESIALKNGYVREHNNGTYSGFVAAGKVAQAETYFAEWYPNASEWLEQFRFTKTEELELLATVDMAMEDLRAEGTPTQLATVKQVIHGHPEWEAKLERPIFSDVNISGAIKACSKLFP